MPKITDPYQELASMFLSGPGAPDRATNGTHSGAAHTAATAPPPATLHRRQPPIELLIVGHLPVRGNLWLAPYADALAREIGPTALVRLDGFEPSVQLLRCPVAAISTPVAESMTHAVEELADRVEQWIIRAPANLNGENLTRAATQSDQITILTGADEAAVVAAYQIIKDIAASEAPQLPPIGMAIVGCEPAVASAVIERMNHTVGSFLSMEIQLTMCLPRMDAAVKSTRYLSFAGQPVPPLGDLMTHIDRARRCMSNAGQNSSEIFAETPAENLAETPAVAGRLYPQAAAPRETRAISAPRFSPDASQVRPPLREAIEGLPHEPVAPSPRRPAIKLAPKPAMLVEGKEPARPVEPNEAGHPRSLVSFVQGLTPLPVRAPGHEKIEIAVDADGRLHLLGHEPALREMPVVQRWTQDHRELLIMACAKHPIDSLAQAKCHIFADRPIAVADLHGADLLLHVLAPVQVKGETAWYCAPLNVTV